MTPSGNLRAWIEPFGANEFIGAFVGEATTRDTIPNMPRRLPATQLCSSPDEARQWIESQAAAFDLPIKWASEIPRD